MSQGRGVWMLLLMVGVVILLMHQLQQPATVDLLGRVFSPPLSGKGNAELASEQWGASGEPVHDSAAQPLVDVDEDAWIAVKDNAIFSSAEEEAWLRLLEAAQHSSAAELARHSVGEVTYAQLVNQPDVYRGRSVRVRGRVLEESVKRPAQNSLGIAAYHQLVLAPVGGGQWPIMVYCLELPTKFPRGAGIKEDLIVDGLFFKNWSYPYDGGMGLAPVLVTPALQWTAPKAAPVLDEQPPTLTGLVIGVLAAGAAAAVFVAWAVFQTRRRRMIRQGLPHVLSLETEP
jgi:hypothetical protein